MSQSIYLSERPLREGRERERERERESQVFERPLQMPPFAHPRLNGVKISGQTEGQVRH